jgi:hypothetical protein
MDSDIAWARDEGSLAAAALILYSVLCHCLLASTVHRSFYLMHVAGQFDFI